MPKPSTNKLDSLKVYEEKKPTAQEQVKNLASFSKAGDFNKRQWSKAMPPMTCNPVLVEQFRKEAKDKKWSFTTLMNEILEERYGIVEEESESK